MSEEHAADRRGSESAPPSPSGKSLFYASPGVSETGAQQEPERSPAKAAPPDDPKWANLIGAYYSDLSEALEKTTTTAMTTLELAFRIRRDAEALLAEAQARYRESKAEVEHLRAQRTALLQEIDPLKSTRDSLYSEVKEIEGRIERIRQLIDSDRPTDSRQER